MLTNDERKILEETQKDLKRMLRRINRILAIDESSNPSEEDYTKNEETVVTQYLIDLGMPTAVNGFMYVRCGILILLSENKRKVPVMKELYPKIAEEYNTNAQKVERGIRTAIEKTVDNHNPSDELMDLLRSGRHEKPTNSEFLALVTEKIRLGL